MDIQLKMVRVATYFALASAIAVSTARNNLDNIKNVVVLVQENR